MSNRSRLACAAVAWVLLPSAIAQEPGPAAENRGRAPCTELRSTSKHNWNLGLFRSGRYCLTHDIVQPPPPFIRLPHQARPSGSLIGISASNVDLDMQGHTARTAGEWNAGVSHVSSGLMAEGQETRKVGPKHNIRIANGTIKTRGRPAVSMTHVFNTKNRRFAESPAENRPSIGPPLADSGGDLAAYEHTGYVLENLTITAEQLAIVMQGKNNVIRRCRITGGNAAVNLYGPNLVFEDNEIIVHASARGPDSRELPMALYLEDAANSTVRRNRIRIEGDSAEAAIVLKNSPGVVLEGNTVIGARRAYQLLDERSSVRPAGLAPTGSSL